MIRAYCLSLAALLASLAILSGPVLAQQSSQQQRRGATPQKAQQTQSAQRNGAQQKANAPAAQSKAASGSGGTLVASFQDWGAHVSGQGRSQICYAVSEPKERLPKELKRDPAYLFVSFRATERMKQEVAIRMGFATNEGKQAEVSVGQSTYALLTKGTDAWLRDQTEESRLVADMIKGQALTVTATSGRGNATTDRYSLSGFTQAWERVRKECQ
jgi:hypothetical protein